jgi:hypothetical protein
MVTRRDGRDGRDAQKRDRDVRPSWATDYDNRMDATLPQFARPTDSNDDPQAGAPSALTWIPTPGVPPPFVSQYLTTSTLIMSTTRNTSPHTLSGYTTIVTTTKDSLTGAASGSGFPSIEGAASGSTSPNIEGGSTADTERKEHSSQGPVYAAAGAIPVVIVAIIIFVVLFRMRKRRKQRQLAVTHSQVVPEMKARQPTVNAYMAPAIPASRAPSYTASTHNMQRLRSPPPVILGPISAGFNGNYMTGIDTSDVMSTRNERTGLGDPFTDGNSLHEEPPPPYKPRSLASRNSSLRIPRSSMSVSSQHYRHSPHRHTFQSLQNPFEDPREDEVVSDLSGPTLHRDSDSMSVVSDLSYQQDPQVERRST